jgi:WD40 repeat protein/serine/threonine protein kinase
MADRNPLPLLLADDELADFVCRLRRSVFPSQQEAARFFGLHHTTVGRYEKGEVTPPLGYLAYLLKTIASMRALADPGGEDVPQKLLKDLNRIIHRYYQEAQELKTWDELCNSADDYLAGRQRSAAQKIAPAPLQPVAPVPVPALPAPASPRGYTLHESVGRGAFGTVYRATQTGLGREVAIKVIHQEYTNQPEFIRRFDAEAQFVARLEHPHIVPLYDYWRDPMGAYLVMRYFRGGNLQTALAREPLSLSAITRCLDQIGGALETAHLQSIIHRDLKPANILLDDGGNFYLADFGIAKDLRELDAAMKTTPGVLLGSPMYVAPELIREQPATHLSDIYSLGLIVYEALTGMPAYAQGVLLQILHAQLYEPLPLLAAVRPDLPPGIQEVLARATAKEPADRYPDVAGLVRAFRQAALPPPPVLALHATPAGVGAGVEALSGLPPERSAPPNPYKGLRAFQEPDAPDFFGRTALVDRLLARLKEPTEVARFLAVVGPSGSGKSSVVKAGLLPALRRGALPTSDRWFVVDLAPGTHPFEEVEAALLRVAVNPPASLLEQLAADDRGLLRAIKRVLPSDPDTDLLLVIDQFEEVFTLIQDEATRARFFNSLYVAVTDPTSRLRLVITLRADFYDRPLLYPGLGHLLQARTEVVLPLTSAEVEQAIVGPAARVGVEVAPSLVAAIMRDVGVQPGALPLLQYALTELFGQRQGRRLTLEAYQAGGGVLDALGRRAEEIYAGLDDAARLAAQQLFLWLVTPGDGMEDTRRRVLVAELAAAAPDPVALERGLDAFGRYRLLAFDYDPITHGPTVEVAHEALLRTWKRLQTWLEASRGVLRAHRQLQAAAREWVGAGRDPSFLATGTRLTLFEALSMEVKREDGLALSGEERAYLEASVARREKEIAADQARQTHELELARQAAQAAEHAAQASQRAARSERSAARRLRVLVAALGIALLVAAVLALFALNQQRDAETKGQQALAASALSAAQHLAAEANTLLVSQGNAELTQLLSIRSLQTHYTPEGDSALDQAAELPIPVRRFVGHTAGVDGAALSPDGAHILTGSSDTTVRLWNAQTGTQLWSFTGFTDTVKTVAFSPDGAVALAGGADGTVRLLDVATGQASADKSPGQLHTAAVRTAVFSADGKTILSAGDDRTVVLWDIATHRRVWRFTGHTDTVYSVTFSPDGNYVLTGSWDGTARLLATRTGAEVTRFTHPAQVDDVAFSPDGKYVLTSCEDKRARLWEMDWNTRTGTLKRDFPQPDLVVHVAFAPDGQSIVTGGPDGVARLWDVETGEQRRYFAGHSTTLSHISFSADGHYLLTSSWDGTAALWDIQARAHPWFVGHTKGLDSAVFSPAGNTVLTASEDATARLWDARSGRELQRFTGHGDTVNAGAVFSPDGLYVLTGGNDQTARLWDLHGTQVLSFSLPTQVSDVRFSPDGNFILMGGADGKARLGDRKTGRIIQTLDHGAALVGTAFAPDGKYALTGGYDKTLRLWDLQTGQAVRSFTGHTDIITNVAFSPDGSEALSGSLDKTARLWDRRTGRELRRFVGHTDGIYGVAFSPDGRYVLTASLDKTARLWDAQTGQELRRFVGHTDSVVSVAFSPNGKQVLTASSDGTARLWDANYHDTIALLCGRLGRDFSANERQQYGIVDARTTCP